MLTAVLQYAHGRFAYVPEVLHQATATTDRDILAVTFGLQVLLLLVELNVFSFVLLELAQGLREVLHQTAATTDLSPGCFVSHLPFSLQLLHLHVELNLLSFLLLVLAQGLLL